MNIRDAGFWCEIEGLFPGSEQVDPWLIETGGGQCICSHPQLLDRIRTACYRAERNNNYVLLILIQLLSADRKKIAHASRLSVCLRASDSLCDLGADRLGLLIDDVHDAADAPFFIERLVSVLAGAAIGGGRTRFSKPCVGATLFPVEGMTGAEVWASTEAALDKAISVGAGAYNLAPMATGRAAMERFELSKDLYTAYRNKEFEIVYQPIVDLGDQRIRAVEVLLRWQHPFHGSLAPDLFLPMLEESGLIVPVGEHVLADACQFLATLRSRGYEDFRACINISPRQLEDAGFLLSVLDALYDADLDPGWLQLEFPESIVTSQSRLVKRILPELRNAGVQLALDHFGTGNVPLADLVRLPINLIKLDRSLIEHIADDAVSRAITAGTLALASAAGMQVAAVGVEKDLQSSVLERLGCCEAQGLYYSNPLSGAKLQSMLAEAMQ